MRRSHGSLVLIAVLLLRVLFLGPVAGARAEVDQTEAPDLKAAVLYQLVNYVEWPSDEQKRTLRISVLGDEGLLESLVETFADPDGDGRDYEIVPAASVDELVRSDVIYVGDGFAGSLNEVLVRVGADATLVVGESDGFAAAGGMINFFFEDQMLRFEVNRSALDRAKLFLSSRVLALSRIVEDAR